LYAGNWNLTAGRLKGTKEETDVGAAEILYLPNFLVTKQLKW
jgi:hypothetical protein